MSPPRIHCIPATAAPVVAVIRRGPSNWSQVGRWDLAAGRYEPGAWLRGRIYARRSDLSPDGRLLCCFVLRGGSRWDHGDTYVAISRLPWLHALHAFGTAGTWTRGYRFTEDGSWDEDVRAPLPMRWGLAALPVVQFASERFRGWVEAPDSPPRDPSDRFDAHRHSRIEKRQPGGELMLIAEHVDDDGAVRYVLRAGSRLEPLDDLQWADWDEHGRLLAATRAGRLQLRNLAAGTAGCDFDEDLAGLRPRPQRAPDDARRW